MDKLLRAKQMQLFELYGKKTELDKQIQDLRIEIDKLSFLLQYPTLNFDEKCVDADVPAVE